MKLIMESWRKLEEEEKFRQQILEYLDENNITLTEAELEEAMPRWLKKLGAGAALGATLMGAPATAQAAGAPADDAPVQVDQTESSSTTLDITVPMRGSLQNAMDRAGQQARLKGAGELNTAPENVTVQRTDVKMGSGTVTVSFNVSVK